MTTSQLSALAWGSLLLLALTACGGRAPKAVPEPPSLVTVTPGPNVLHVSWLHGGEGASEYIVYREPRGVSAAVSAAVSTATELVRVPKHSSAHSFHSYMDEGAGDETRFSYSVAAVGPGGTSAATPQTNGVPRANTPLELCGGAGTSADSDGDGVSNKAEATGWTVSVVTQTASATGVDGKLERDITKAVKTSDPANPDTDGDGLCDHQELTYRTDAADGETDQDGLSDFDELFVWGSDPNNLDSDDDAFKPTLVVSDGQQRVDDLTLSSGNPALFDGSEVDTYQTSPTLADTDGDSYSDYYEIIEAGGDFNPLVANLPQLELSLVGTADLVVNIGYTDSAQQADTKSVGLESGQSTSDTTYHSNVRKVWHQYDQSASLSGGYDKDGFSASVKLKASFEEGSATTKTNGWSSTSSQNSQKTYDAAVRTAREQGRTIQGGSITMGVKIANTGDITYNLSDLAVTALQRDPNDPASFKTIATLTLADPLGTGGVSLAPNSATDTLEVEADLTAANVVLDLMADPSSLLFEIGTFSISNEQEIDFNFLEQVTDAQTGLVVVDFGNGDVISKRVATNVARTGGKITGVPLGKALQALGLEFQTQTTEVAGNSVAVLTSVTDKATGNTATVNSSKNSFWATLKTADATTPIAQDFGDIVLGAGGAVYLLYVTDGDEDGLYLRDETLHGTSDTVKDGDGDGRSDGDEVKTGWRIDAQLPPLFPGTVYSDPTLADADHDGLNDAQELSLTTDPNNPDTDGDSLCDGGGSALSATSVCKAGVTPDPEPLIQRFVFLADSSSPAPYTISAQADAPTLVANFSVPIKASSTFTVRSSVRGPLTLEGFTFSNGGRTLTAKPKAIKKWLPGEELYVAFSNITSEMGQKLPVYQYRFRAKTDAAGRFPGTTSAKQNVPNNSQSLTDVATGDFDQNGLTDLATLQGSRVVVLLQNSTGWDSAAFYSLKAIGRSLVVGDFNSDRRLDLAVGIDGGEIGMLLARTPKGEFSGPTYVSAGNSVIDLATADFDGDGNLDLVTASYVFGGGADENSVLLGNGNGTFRTGTSLRSGYDPQSVTTGDVSGDGLIDIIAGFRSPNGFVGVYLYMGNGDGSFSAPRSYPAPNSSPPTDLATGDFNGDGLLDVVTANEYSGDVSLLLSQPNGTLAQQPNLGSMGDDAPLGLVTADFDGDGTLDIAVSRASKATVFYAKANGGTFDRQDVEFTGYPKLSGFGLAAVLVGTPESAPLSLVVTGVTVDDSGGNAAFTTLTP